MSTQQSQQQQGLGVITFYAVEDGPENTGIATALIRPAGDQWHRGAYIIGHGVDIENDDILLALRVPDRATENGPKLRGKLTFRTTGEVVNVVGWNGTLEDGTPCIGLSADRPLPQRRANPFA